MSTAPRACCRTIGFNRSPAHSSGRFGWTASSRSAIWRKLFFELGYFAPFAPIAYAEEVEELLEAGREERERRQWDGLMARSPRRFR